MGLKTVDILVTLIINVIQYSCAEHILPCNETVLYPCPVHQLCNATSHQCVCVKGFIKVGDDCETPDENNDLTIVTVTIFTLALLITGAVLIIRKYNLIETIWQKIQARRNNDVMYEDVMIGNDDPPLSP